VTGGPGVTKSVAEPTSTRVATRADPENAPFNVVVHGQGISVWVNAGLDAEVFDAQGGLVPCAHQRPDGVFKSAAR
jgi:hypothetical protein